MNILILGSGGREHALAWAIRQNPKCDTLICAPGNAGIEALATCLPLNIMDGAAVTEFAKTHRIDFVVIGPEAPLAAGVGDALRATGILCFGPGAKAAQLEASKAFTKEICAACNAPTAAYRHFKSAGPALEYVQDCTIPIVIKADGLAAGKGVVIADTRTQAIETISEMFDGQFGQAGAEIIIEEFMQGEEASFFVLSDGTNVLPLGTAQDHKRAFDNDQGPNTGGMGAYSPAPVMDDTVTQKALDEIIQPTIDEMARRGTPFSGVLYAGFMIEHGQPRLVEYNVRFGDPECQVLCMRLGAQMLDALLGCAQGSLDKVKINWADDHALCIVMAANGYPGNYEKGSEIKRIDAGANDPAVQIFHAGTKHINGAITANGGRVLNITARGETLQQARDRAYALVDEIDWPQGFYRTDIGWRAL